MGSDSSSLFLPLTSDPELDEDRAGLTSLDLETLLVEMAASLLVDVEDELLRLAATAAFFSFLASSFNIAAALLNPPMPPLDDEALLLPVVDEETKRDLLLLPLIRFVRSVPAPHFEVDPLPIDEGPAMISISLLLASASLEVEAVIALLISELCVLVLAALDSTTVVALRDEVTDNVDDDR